jgi:hypothetical protein
MKIFIRLGTIACCFLAVSANAQQPGWNAEQSEVWALIEQSWVDDVAENGKWPADYLLDNYVAWGEGTAAPRYKDAMIKWTRFGYAGNETLMYEVSPAAIVIQKDTAVVHYNVTSVIKDSSGKQSQSVGRITEVLVRNGKSWKWLAGVDFEPKLNDE